MAVSGMYICFVVRAGVTGANAKRPPRRSSSSDANTLGESKRGQQNQSIVPSVATSAARLKIPDQSVVCDGRIAHAALAPLVGVAHPDSACAASP